MKDVARRIEEAIDRADGSTAKQSHPGRAFDGQAHTHNGERGKQPIFNMRVRDIADCLIRAYFLSADPDDPMRVGEEDLHAFRYTQNDVYGLNFDKMDPLAIQQNLVCEIERAMGIYPNIPGRRGMGDDDSVPRGTP